MAALVDIFNSALVKVGAGTILSPAEESREAQLCSEQWPKVFAETLMAHPWECAAARAVLAPDVEAPSFEWAHQYTLPANCLIVRELTDSNGVGYYPFEIEGRKLLTDANPAYIRYTRSMTSPAEIDPLLAEVLALRLAVEIAYSLVQSASLAELVARQYETRVQEARSILSRQSSIRVRDAGSWIASRG